MSASATQGGHKYDEVYVVLFKLVVFSHKNQLFRTGHTIQIHIQKCTVDLDLRPIDLWTTFHTLK